MLVMLVVSKLRYKKLMFKSIFYLQTKHLLKKKQCEISQSKKKF